MAPLSLAEAFALIPDPRDRRGRQHPLVAMLCLSAVAILAGGNGLPYPDIPKGDHLWAFKLGGKKLPTGPELKG